MAPTRFFARAVLDLGGQTEAVVPAALYRAGLPADAHAEYDRLLARAVKVHRLPFTQSTSEAHMAASDSCSTTPTCYGRSGTGSQPEATEAPPTWSPPPALRGCPCG